MPYTQEQFWVDRKTRGFRDAVSNALVSLLPGDEPPPADPDPEPPAPGNSGTAPGQTKPPKKPK